MQEDLTKKDLTEEDLTEEDLTEAMKEMHTYMDITPGDLKKIYVLAIRHAKKKLQSPKAREVMTSKVISITQEASLDDAMKLLAEHHISGMPVVNDEKKVIGVITEADIIEIFTGKRRTGLLDIFHRKEGTIPSHVKNVMTAPAITVTPTTPVYEIADIFTKKKINRVPVVDEQNTLTGIVARADIVKAYEKLRSL